MELLRHLEIGDVLLEDIQSGRYTPNGRFASETELMSRFDASRYVVRLALGRLVQLGFLRPVQGVGYFVQQAPLNLEYRITSNAHHSAQISAQGHTPGMRVMAADTLVAPPEIAAQLTVAQGTLLHRLELVRTADDVPVSWCVTWLLASACPKIVGAVTDNCSLYSLLRRRCDLDLTLVRITFFATHAMAKDVKYLKLGSQGVIMASTNHAADQNGRLVEYTQMRSRGDVYNVTIPFGHQTINTEISEQASQQSEGVRASVQA